MSNMKSLASISVIAACAVSHAEVVFNNIPGTLDPNYASLGYQATQTSEFGDKVTLGGVGRQLSNATFTMSSWAKKSTWSNYGDDTGFDHSVTLNIYAAGDNNTVGALLGTSTQVFHMLWRPEADPNDPKGRWLASDGEHYSGLAFNISFDLSSLNLTLPETFIYGLAYNTQTWGYAPIGGAEGPYCSLNYACEGIAPTVGVDVDPDGVYWNTATAGWYGDKGASGYGIFRYDHNADPANGWTGYAPMARFETLGEPSVPGPAAVLPFAVGLLAAAKRRRK